MIDDGQSPKGTSVELDPVFDASRFEPRSNGSEKGTPRFGLIPFQTVVDAAITASEFRLYALLCCYRRSKKGDMFFGWAWPSQRRLAADLRVGTRQLSKHLLALRKAGFLEVWPRRHIHRLFPGSLKARYYYLPQLDEGRCFRDPVQSEPFLSDVADFESSDGSQTFHRTDH